MTTPEINPYQPPLSDPWELGAARGGVSPELQRAIVWALCAGLGCVVSLNLAEALLHSALASRAQLDGAIAHHKVEVLTTLAWAFKLAELGLFAMMLPGLAWVLRRGPQLDRVVPRSFWIAACCAELLALGASWRTHVAPSDVPAQWAGAGLQLIDALLCISAVTWLMTRRPPVHSWSQPSPS